jgi:glycosyl hydrolase family 18 (putative chitinase)
MSSVPSIGRSVRRIAIAIFVLIAIAFAAYTLWRPGLEVRDGRHDRRSNGVWLAHGWLGADDWFTRNNKTNEFTRYRSAANVRALAEKLRGNHITDVFPHLCPADPTGQLPAVDPDQVARFLDAFPNSRVLPWIGGPNGTSVRANNAKWRATFAENTRHLLTAHPRLAGVHLNVEPLPSGDKDYLLLLDELRAALPPGKLLSVAAYPPPTRWHPFPEVHWDEAYFREVARRCDQIAVMMYDAGQKIPKTYQRLMADWTEEVLQWSEGKAVLLGVPTYDDAGAGYHDPKVENLRNALLGIHRGLSRNPLPSNYQGVAIYCEWETSDAEWNHFREHFKAP